MSKIHKFKANEYPKYRVFRHWKDGYIVLRCLYQRHMEWIFNNDWCTNNSSKFKTYREAVQKLKEKVGNVRWSVNEAIF